jgi:signal transduction histidine kinase
LNWLQLIRKTSPYIATVILAFALMAMVGFVSTNRVMRQRLNDQAEGILKITEGNLDEGLARAELVLLTSYHQVRGLMDRGADNKIILDYMQGTTNWMGRDLNGIEGFNGIYGYIRGKFIDGLRMNPGEDYIPEERPWFKAAAGLKDGEVAYTAPYIDAHRKTLIISAVKNVYSLSGEYYGILALDIDINWFSPFAQDLSGNPGSYSLITDQSLSLLSHPDPARLGQPLGGPEGLYRQIVEELREKGKFWGRRFRKTNGDEAVAFARRLSNGWYSALIIPLKDYYQDIYNMQVNTAFLGLFLIILFSLIMLRITAKHIRAEEISADKTNFLNRLEETVRLRTQELEERTQELEIQTILAQEASEAKGSFLARMSHEIRTPLNAVIGMTEVAIHSTDAEKKNRSLQEVLAASEHLLGILNDVLDISKIESGKFTIANGPFALGTAMEEVRTIILQRCMERYIEFDTNFSGLQGITVMGDKLRLKQVLINLLGNAVKFTPENGNIWFLVNIEDRMENQIHVHFMVCDNGIGMKSESMGKLFTPFEQGDRSIATRFGGTGLGLAISQNLVLQMGGFITVESVYGEGTLFEFTLEMELSGEAEKTEKHDCFGNPDFSNKRLLLAEDIDINRVVVQEFLADTHIIIEEVVDGSQAVEVFTKSAENYYDLILMDIQMPNMDGLEATRRIRAMDRQDAKTIPIIAMTANVYREDVEQALAAGMNAHLPKPLKIRELEETLHQWLDGTR